MKSPSPFAFIRKKSTNLVTRSLRSKMADDEGTPVSADVTSGEMIFEPIIEDGVFRFDCSGNDREAAHPSLSFVNSKDRETPVKSQKMPSCIPKFECLLGQQIVKLEILLTIILLFLSLLPSSASLHAASGSTKSRPEVIYARHGAVATDDGRCSKIGMTVLREGGHAVDASVAAALCLGVVSPASSGIGGGAFMLIRQGNGKAQAFDMRETTPALASQLYPNLVHYENWTTVIGDHFELPAQIRKSLQKKGHVLEPLAGGAICQFIVIEALKKNGGSQEFVTVSDPRKGGIPAGF